MATLSEALSIALANHQAGRLQAAEQIYRQVLAADPNQLDALHLLGILAHQSGKHQAAVDFIGRAIAIKPDEPSFHSNQGNAFNSLGNLDQAAACYRRALALKPDFVDAHNNLGNVLRDQGQLAEAVACYERALELKPDYAEAHAGLGLVLETQGRLPEALASYRRALELKPHSPETLNNLGNALRRSARLDEAVACYRRALELQPRYPKALNNLGVALREQGKLDEAVACYRRALEFQPDYAGALTNLGNALKDQGDLAGAIACQRRALELAPRYAEAHNNLGSVLAAQGLFREAIACYRRALELRPEFAGAYNNLGSALKDDGRADEALGCYRRAIELEPDLAGAHNNLGIALAEQGRLEEAEACYRRAVTLSPDYAEAHSNLGGVFKDQGKLDQAVACYRHAIQIKPDDAKSQSNLLLALQYRPGVTLPELAAAHAEYDRRLAAPLRAGWRPHENSRDPDRRLRVGFVSSDLGRHPVGYFLIRLLENLDRADWETVCFSDRLRADDLTARIRAAATGWRDVIGLTHERLAAEIAADRVDILFDLAGHTARNRLLVFARKPAPIQVTWAGYVGTTGLQAMDYILADRWQVPAGGEAYYREWVLRMPDGYVCYDPPADSPAVSALPAASQGRVTFGSFNNPAKINPRVIELWAAILRRLPQSRLVLKYKGIDDRSVARSVALEFGRHGVAPDRIECLGASDHAALLAEYGRIDVALDPFPYNGGLTTCEALWMGVPVVTCPGETFASRHSLGHLSNVGLTETIANDFGEYVAIAVALSEDLPRLARLRAGLRERIRTSPLCDGPRFAQQWALLLRNVWREWVGRSRQSSG